ncbi:MAG: winged helix-turn-helix domain-containing protein [Dehalococcoidia bacterium]
MDDTQRGELQAARHDPTLTPWERDRVEMLLLSAAGWSPPRIATHFGCAVKPVHTVLDAYPLRGLSAVRRQRPGRKPNAARRQAVTGALTTLLADDRTWTTAQLAAALGEQRISLGPRQTRRYVHGLGFRWRRTHRTLAHQQNPAKVTTATHTLAALKKGRWRGSSGSVASTKVASVPVSR